MGQGAHAWVRRPWLILAVWLVTRAWAVASGLQHLPYPRNDILFNDVDVYVRWSESIAAGVFPFHDEMWQYPPLAGLVFVAARFTPLGPYVGFVALALLADLALQLVVLARARATGSWSGAWVWALTAAIVGPIMLGRFDVFPTLLAVIAVAAVATPVRSGIWAAVGAMLKVWPVLALLALPRRALLRGGTAFVATGIVVMAAVLTWSGGGLSFLSFQRSRGLQMEAVAALPFHWWHLLGHPLATEYRYGSLELDVAGAGPAAAIATVIGVALLGWLGVARLLGRLESVAPADVVLTAVLVAVASSRVFSPQYAVWVLGLAALALTDPRTRLRPVVPLVAVGAIAAQLVYPLWYGDLMDGTWFAVALQTLRIVTFMAALVLAVVRVLVHPPAPDGVVQDLTSPPEAAVRSR